MGFRVVSVASLGANFNTSLSKATAAFEVWKEELQFEKRMSKRTTELWQATMKSKINANLPNIRDFIRLLWKDLNHGHCLSKKTNNDGFFGQGALRGRLSYSSRLPPVPACPFAPPWPPRKQHCLMEKDMEKYIVYMCLFGDQTGTLCITVSAIYQHLDSPDSAECWFLRCLSNGSDVFNPVHPIYGYSSSSLSINIPWPSLTYKIEKEWCLWQVVTDGRCPL